MNATNINNAAINLLRNAHRLGGIVRKEWFVYGDAEYDQIPFAISLGLRQYLAKSTILVYAYLEFMFFADTLSLRSTGLATLEKDEGGYVFALTDKGRCIWRGSGRMGHCHEPDRL